MRQGIPFLCLKDGVVVGNPAVSGVVLSDVTLRAAAPVATAYCLRLRGNLQLWVRTLNLPSMYAILCHLDSLLVRDIERALQLKR